MNTGVVAQGAKLSYGDGGSPESFTDIPGTVDMEIPMHQVAAIEFSGTDEAQAGYEPGKPKVKACSGNVNFDPDNSPQQQLRTDQLARTKRNWRITIPDTSPDTTVTFEAFVSDLGNVSIADDDKLTMPFTLQPTGAVAWA